MRLILWFLCLSSVLLGAKFDIEISGTSAILMNGQTGAILYEKHAHLPLSPASTTKIATALFVLDHEIDLRRQVIVSREALKTRPQENRYEYPPHWHDRDGTMMGLKVGEEISFDTLLYGLMLVSGNDAANVLAENIGGTVPQFMEMVNEYLKNIGCKNTQFSNPHGLTHPEHWSTAYDLALMTKRALQFPKFRKVVSTLSYTKPKTNKQPEVEIKLTNPLLKPNSRYYYPKAIGVKTGYTSAAKNTLVAAAEFEGRTLIAVVLGCEERQSRYEDVKRLFEKAFAEIKSSRRLIGPEHLFEKEVPGSKQLLKAGVIKPISIEFFPSEEPKCKAALHWDIEKLPIRKGQKVGEVHVLSDDGRFLEKGDLVAKFEIRGSIFLTLKEKLRSFFN